MDLIGQAVAGLGQPTQAQPFVWGSGGRRMTPDQIASEREIANALMRSDYSPIRSVWQGLGRVADGLIGGYESRQLDKAQAANAARSDAVAQALTTGSGGNDVVAAALTDPYTSPEVRAFAKMQYDRLNPKPAQPTDLMRNYGWLAGMGRQDDADALIGRATQADPLITTVLPGGQFYSGPQSQLGSFLQGASGGAAASPSAPAIGTVEDGYVFKGGDPSDPANWRKQ